MSVTFTDEDKLLVEEMGKDDFLLFNEEDKNFCNDVVYQSFSLKGMVQIMLKLLHKGGKVAKVNFKHLLLLSRMRGPKFSSYKKITEKGKARVQELATFWNLKEEAKSSVDVTLPRIAIAFAFLAALAGIFLKRIGCLPDDPSCPDGLPQYLAFAGAVAIIPKGSTEDELHAKWALSRTEDLRSTDTPRNNAYRKKTDEEKLKIVQMFRRLGRSQELHSKDVQQGWLAVLRKKAAETRSLEGSSGKSLEEYKGDFPSFLIGKEALSKQLYAENELLDAFLESKNHLELLRRLATEQRQRYDPQIMDTLISEAVSQNNKMSLAMEYDKQRLEDGMNSADIGEEEKKENSDRLQALMSAQDQWNSIPEDSKKRNLNSAITHADFAKRAEIVKDRVEEAKRQEALDLPMFRHKEWVFFQAQTEKQKNPKTGKKDRFKNNDWRPFMTKSLEEMDIPTRMEVYMNENLILRDLCHSKYNLSHLAVKSVLHLARSKKPVQENKPRIAAYDSDWLPDEYIVAHLKEGKHL